MNLETEIQQLTNLCDPSGKLNRNAIGWSKSPLHRCNLKGNWLRKKKWNYWCFYDEEFLASFTVSDVDYAGVIFCYWLDRKTGEFVESTLLTPFGSGTMLGQTVANNATYEGKNGFLRFQTNEDGDYIIKVDFMSGTKKSIQADLKLQVPENWESLNVTVPWSSRRFQFTHKLFGLGAQGTVKVPGKTHTFQPKTSFGVLDFGRGIWPYSTKWNWASMSYRPGGNEVYGVNLGGGWTDGTGTTENALLINGRIYKIPSVVAFEFDKKNPEKPWVIYSKESKAVELVLTPDFHRKAVSNVGIIASRVDQMIGSFEGVLRVGKSEFRIEKGQGWAENHTARW
ncbi:DUF2804 domain-containing protein [Leptospira wolffii]|uniref:DUF2804 domain-containing protein n=1 Tax=Leptospira wolffii TaxID=409998 RepID=UPI0010824142|nr:DUF2804 domain-containing protein [Leptospira wolffii]TGK61575.1 DUF2804 domain-containing protein [Leptospira wolffii]TGK70119.1 DUF2804 domain-containing protein [Leptospira wolffii]TGK77042.1 DUF2804 domain-containing protein [Leptospira wolffii]TGL31106.1 DUF2804 domain-containing protein [Leptospira wolffii]